MSLHVKSFTDTLTITFLEVETFGRTLPIPVDYPQLEELAFLGGHTINELLDAERRASAFALAKAGRMNRTLTLSRVDAHAIGALLFFLEMETAYMGEFLRINAYDQPGVEAGKIATFALMGRKGYEKEAEDMRGSFAPTDKYTV